MHLHEQIWVVWKQTGWTVNEFLGKSGLKLHRTQLMRRLKGETPMRTREAEKLVDALRRNGFDVTLTWPSTISATRHAA